MRYGALYGLYAAICLRGAYVRLTRGLCDCLKFWNINYEMNEKDEKRLVCLLLTSLFISRKDWDISRRQAVHQYKNEVAMI